MSASATVWYMVRQRSSVCRLPRNSCGHTLVDDKDEDDEDDAPRLSGPGKSAHSFCMGGGQLEQLLQPFFIIKILFTGPLLAIFRLYILPMYYFWCLISTFLP